MSSDVMRIALSSPTLGWTVWQEQVQKRELIPNTGNLNAVFTIEITCAKKMA